MCSTCGCGQPDEEVTILVPGEKPKKKGEGPVQNEHMPDHDHHHGHDHHHHHHHDPDHHHHDHDHPHEHGHREVIDLERDILQKNDLLAERNRGYFEAKNIVTLNMMSSPGSGKTTLLEATIRKMDGAVPVYVIEGDQQTMNDAERIASTHAKVVQVNTGKGCHLDSDMVHRAVLKLQPENNALLFIENVGNLVCPSLFDLGEGKRVVIMSVTEGEDKPVKYPDMFISSDLCIINKTDLLPYLKFDMDKAKDYIKRINHHMDIMELSAQTGEGLDVWIDWLTNMLK